MKHARAILDLYFDHSSSRSRNNKKTTHRARAIKLGKCSANLHEIAAR